MSGQARPRIDSSGISDDDTVCSAIEPHLSANPLFDNQALTYADLVLRLKTPKRTLERLVSKGQIPHKRLGARQVRFYWPDIVTWLRDQGERRDED